MPHTANRWFCDTPHTGGWVFKNAIDLGGQTTRVSEGIYTLSVAATGVVVAHFGEMRRLLENQFAPLSAFTGGSGPGPGSVPGFPPFAGASQLVPPSEPVAKGIQITDVVAIYNVGTADLTSVALALSETVYANNVAPVVNAIPLAVATPPLAVQANPYVLIIPVADPEMIVDDLSDINLEFSVTIGGGATAGLFGLGYHCNYNFD